MKYKIELSDDSLEELDYICQYLNFISRTNNLSYKLILEIYKNIGMLSSSPEIYPKMNIKDRYGHELRKIIIGNYLLIYYIIYNENLIYITHIFDARSNYLKNLF